MHTGRYVGIALDVSSSMQQSLPDSASAQLDRFQSVLRALHRVVLSHEHSASGVQGAVDAVQMCAYLFGATVVPSQVCDLFSLLTVVRSADHADQGSDRPIDDPYDYDPYAYLESVASRADRSPWVEWIRQELTHTEAHILASNLHRFGVAAVALGRLLPDVSEANLRVLRGMDQLRGKGIENRIRGTVELTSSSPFAFLSAGHSVARSGGNAT